MKIDYENRARIIKSGLPKILSAYNKAILLFNKCVSNPKFTYGQYDNYMSLFILEAKIEKIKEEAYNKFNIDIESEVNEDMIEAYKINRASWQRQKRLRKKIVKMFSKPCLFLTLTFDNHYLDSTSDATKRTYVSRILNQFKVPYIANVDYGKKNNRLHYHAIIQIDRVNHRCWPYGAINFEKIRILNSKALSKYLDKLTNHAIKETCKGNRLIYSKNV